MFAWLKENMNHFVKTARHLANFFLSFVHGAFVMAGVLVVAVVAYQVSHFGLDGLDPRQFAQTGTIESADGAALNTAHAKLTPEFVRLSRYIARRYKVSQGAVDPLVAAAVQEGRANQLDPLLILAVVSVESSFNPLAESVVGAQGLMQIMPRFHSEKISWEKGQFALLDPQENVRVGAMILREYIRRKPDLPTALQQYAGASNDMQMGYANKVVQEMDKLRSVMHPASNRAQVARDATSSSEAVSKAVETVNAS